MVDIVLYDNVDFSNGFANVLPTNRITIYLTPPAGDIGLARYDDWLRLVITHELTHIFHLDRADGVWGDLQHVFGRAPMLFPNTYRPGWVVEGLAVYYESRLTGGGRVRGGFHGQVLTAATADSVWPAPGDANFTTGRWPVGVGPYAFGSRFFAFEAATYGDTSIRRFIDHTSARLWPFGISSSLSASGARGLYSDWMDFHEAWRRSVRGGSRGTVIARGLRGEPRAHLSPDGRRLAYIVADGRTREHVVMRDVASGAIVASHGVNGTPEIAWVGDDLVLAQLDYRAPVEIRNSLYRWTPGGAFRKLSRIDRLLRPFSLPGGETGALLLEPARITVVRVTGTSGVESLPVPPADEWSHVAASPDGRFLAGARHANGRWDIVLWPTGSPAAMRMVTDDQALDDDPSWSSDGRRIVLTSERSGLPQIYAFDVATGETTRLTDEPTGAREADVAPDGTVYFSTLLSDGYAVMSASPLSPPPAGEGNVTAALPRASETASPSPSGRGVRGEEGYRPWNSLLPRYWLPTVHVGDRTVGRFVGAATSGSDVVGRTAYAADLAHSVNNARWEGFVGLAYSRWGAVTLDVSARQFWGTGGVAVPNATTIPQTVSERDRSVVAGGTIRHQWWRSEIAARLGAEMSQEAFFLPDSFNVRYANPEFLGSVASLLVSRTDRHSLSISTEDGVQLAALYRRKWATDGTGWASELRGSVRGFLGVPLPGFSHWVIAGRVSEDPTRGDSLRAGNREGHSPSYRGSDSAAVSGISAFGGIRQAAPSSPGSWPVLRRSGFRYSL